MKNRYKVTRGALEEEQRREEIHLSNQKVILIVLPIIMFAVLLIGIFFGYKSYKEGKGEEITPSEVIETQNQTINDEELLVMTVNSANPLDESFVPNLVKYQKVKVSPLMLDDLKRLMEDSKEAGVKVLLKSGYISYKEQKKKYNNSIKEYKKKHKCTIVKAESEIKKKIPEAGESEQQTGLVVYFGSTSKKSFKKSDVYDWLYKHSVDYGFVLRYPSDENSGGMVYNSHLFRYVGVENAIKMRALNLDFDEYIQYKSMQ